MKTVALVIPGHTRQEKDWGLASWDRILFLIPAAKILLARATGAGADARVLMDIAGGLVLRINPLPWVSGKETAGDAAERVLRRMTVHLGSRETDGAGSCLAVPVYREGGFSVSFRGGE